jgi:hypothetical protein
VLKTVLFLACAAAIVVAQLFILRLALSRETAVRGDATLPRSRRAVELTWAFLPAIGLALVLWMTWREIPRSRVVAPPPPSAHPTHGAHES